MKMRPAELELVSRVTISEMIEYMTLSPTVVSIAMQVVVAQSSPWSIVGNKYSNRKEGGASFGQVEMAAGAAWVKDGRRLKVEVHDGGHVDGRQSVVVGR
jgi:hypothetical protein